MPVIVPARVKESTTSGNVGAESGVAQTGAPLDGGFGKVLQGYVESSNVNVVQQLVDMIETQRAYEVSSKSITAVDEMMQFISRNL